MNRMRAARPHLSMKEAFDLLLLEKAVEVTAEQQRAGYNEALDAQRKAAYAGLGMGIQFALELTFSHIEVALDLLAHIRTEQGEPLPDAENPDPLVKEFVGYVSAPDA